ncbi:uncharacterized protein PSANT_04862 [Moesziomyces antarcticus]|uniref:Uncharacterized protein n=1 Tax=Pseudozyma antarctica TaxID=84753 RepID=A0A5C3FTW1_PSEA2|nr:uncharacterized protein PSANT_04862 [Moesziomyces antarcticus]
MLRLVRLTSIRAALMAKLPSMLGSITAVQHYAVHRPHPDLGEIFALRFRRCKVGTAMALAARNANPSVQFLRPWRLLPVWGPSCKRAPSAGRTLDDMDRDEQPASARATITSETRKLRSRAKGPTHTSLGLGPACAQARGVVVGVDPDYARILAFLSSASTRHNNPLSLATVHGSCAPSSPPRPEFASACTCTTISLESSGPAVVSTSAAAASFLPSARTSLLSAPLAQPGIAQLASALLSLAPPRISPHLRASAAPPRPSQPAASRISHQAHPELSSLGRSFFLAIPARFHRLLLAATFCQAKASAGHRILDEARSFADLHQAQQRLICTPNQVLPRNTTQQAK